MDNVSTYEQIRRCKKTRAFVAGCIGENAGLCDWFCQAEFL